MSSSVASPVVASPTSAPRPLQLLDSNLPSSAVSPTSRGLGLSTPPPSARAFKPANPRRQSSISYFPSDHVPSHEARLPAKGQAMSRRTQSMYVWGDEQAGAVSKVKGDRRSMGELSGSREPLSPRPVVDHGPLTLTEKHADLLQFIAQKESKCLELRLQLEVHERELSQLKRKWERIVSRGMDRAYSSSPPTNGPSPLSHPAVSSLIPSAANAALKEGVRLIAAGLELSSPSAGQQSFSPILSPPAIPVSGLATVSRASIAAARASSAHASTVSVSSASTTATSTSSASQSQRLSQSSASSLTSAFSIEETLEEDVTAKMKRASVPAKTYSHPRSSIEVVPSHGGKLSRRRSYEAEEASSSLTTPMSPRSEATAKLTGQHNPRSPIHSEDSLPSSPVSSLMNTVGRNFTKSQKRASLLLSDVSQSIFAALASPTQSVPSPRNPPSKLNQTTLAPSPSLLEDFEDSADDKRLGDVLAPSVLSPTPAPVVAPVQVQSKPLEDDDDWNW
ncbi:hypothetical protein EIP86_003473 [Pleurotus ostreatoroseus]|nr:hypothetical protein EIP86_003473 [Pleurotus ostreatoroseus]